MSQLPPQMPPMSPMSPQHQGYVPPGYPGATKSNGPAIASLVCGILGCIPILTGLLAIIFGIVGLKKTRDPQVGGKGLAIVGLVLGVLSIAGWGLMGGGMYWGYAKSQPARTVATQFATDLASQNFASAAALTDGVSAQELENAAADYKNWGNLTNTFYPSFNIQTDAATGTTCELAGVATFSTGLSKAYTVKLRKVGDVWKVMEWKFQ